jgi:hypothetical protein
MRNELQLVLLAAKELPVGELPGLLGQIEEIRVTAMARLTAPAPPPQSDVLLDVDEAARRLSLSKVCLYRHLPACHSPAAWESVCFFQVWE